MNRNIVITGANRGIGLELARQYQQAGDKVYAVCRKESQALQALGVSVIKDIDVSDPAAIQMLVNALHDVPVDILINNAGILGNESLGTIDYDQMQKVIDVNGVAPLRVTEALLGNLGSGSKIALVTSRMGSMADNTSGGTYDYRMSKAALNAAGKSLAVDLQELGIAVAILHPGYVQTDMVGGRGDIGADVAAGRLIQRIEGLNLDNTGSFWHSNGELLPW